jgi:hypothetical protein
LALMLYIRFPLSLRNDLLHERGLDINCQTVRYWWHWMALLRNWGLGHYGPLPFRHQATRMISAVPRAEKWIISATWIWISVFWRSGSLAAMRSPNALRHRIFASIRLRTWYPVHRF